MCRYVARPPLSSKRMHIQPNGQILIRLKRAWMDGTQHLEFSPIELLEKLAALVPPPRVNQVLYHGVLAPRAKWRQEIVPKPSEREAFKPLRKCATHTPRRRHTLWAELLWHSFGVDGWACFQCGEHMSLRAVVIHPPATTKVLQGLGGRGPPKVGRLVSRPASASWPGCGGLETSLVRWQPPSGVFANRAYREVSCFGASPACEPGVVSWGVGSKSQVAQADCAAASSARALQAAAQL